MKKVSDAPPRLCSCRLLCVLLFSLVCSAGCSTPQPKPLAASAMPPRQADVTTLNESLGVAAVQAATAAATDYRLGPEDLIQISFYNIIKAKKDEEVIPKLVETRISRTGNITLPLLGEVPASGLTTADLEQELHRRYRKYILNPQLSVHVQEYHSQRVSVFGAVLRPGVFELSSPKTVVDLLALAGGLDEKAGRQVHLSRQGPQGHESYIIDLHVLMVNPDAPMNQVVYGGDVITVPRAGSFFVDGAVGKPGSYLLDRPYTLTQALATAGGVNVDLANTSATQIFRGHLDTEAEALTVDVKKILAGESPNPEIYADDVIVVPVSMPKYIVKRFLGGVGMGAWLPVRQNR
jgi:polysaccharide export outer membrane protein